MRTWVIGSKGTSQQTQAGTSSYTPAPQIMAAGNQALGQASQAATSPFQLPTAPVAGFTPDQLRAFQQTQQQQGFAQPYYNQAQGLFNQSAAPISAGQISQYMNPYASSVLANLQETQGQQMQDLTGRTTQAAGGVGADRIGVAQGELARQQNLATGQTLSGIYGSALSAAQQDAQRQQAAAYGIGNLGGAAQNAAMQGTQALYGQGAIQQQLAQAQMNAPYQNTLARIAYPYQQAQYLSGITGSLAGPLGGTTTSNQFGTTTPAQPSIWSQIAGAGTAGAGAYGALNEAGAFGGLGKGSNPSYGMGNNVYGGSSANPLQGLSPSDYGYGYASGGEVSGEPSWMTADPTIPTIAMHASPINQPKIQPLNMSSGKDSGGIGGDIANIAKTVATVAPLFLAQGGAVGMTPYQAFADGGKDQSRYGDTARPEDIGNENEWRARILLGPPRSRNTPSFDTDTSSIRRKRYADGGDTFDDRFDTSGMGEMPRSEALAHYLRQPATYFKSAYAGPDSQLLPQEQARSVAAPTTRFTVNPQENVINPGDPHRLPSVRADGSPIVPPDQMRADETSEAAGPAAKATGLRALSPAAADTAEANLADMRNVRYNAPYPDLDHGSDVSRGFAKSPWLALINAGAGMMAGTSPYAGVNIGKGLQAGTETLGKQREASREEESVNQRAQQLALEAEKHRDSLTKMSPYQSGQLEQAQSALEQNKWQIVYDPQTQTPYWTKSGEKSVPALPGQAPPTSTGTPISGTTPPAGTGPKVASADGTAPSVAKPLDFAYSPPSNDPATGPGPVFNPKTGALSPEHVQITRAVTDRADKAGEAAADAAVQLGHLKQALSKIDDLKKEAGGMLQTGAFAKQRFELAKTINGITAPFGIEPINPALIGSAEEAGKITTRLGFALSRTLGAREAMQIVQQSIAANPGIENTPEGRRFIISTIEAGIQRNQDMQQFVADYRRHWRSAAGAEAQFNKQNPPEKYIARVGVETAPPEFRNPSALDKAVKRLRSDPSPATVAAFNKIYHGTADYFLKGNVAVNPVTGISP